MEVRLPLILAVCIVSLKLADAQPPNQMTDQVIASEMEDNVDVRQNLQNLFDSISKHDTKKSESLNDILKQGVTDERYAFDTIKGELQMARSRDSHRRRNSYDGNIVRRKFRPAKRQTAVTYNPLEPGEVLYEFNVTILEKMFLEHHPVPEGLVWEEAENLTPEVLEHICINDILLKVLPRAIPDKPYNVTTWNYVQVPASKLQEERVVKGATLLMHNRKTRIEITVVKCVFKRHQFFLTHAKDDHVFTLFADVKPNHFRLRMGMYRVNYISAPAVTASYV